MDLYFERHDGQAVTTDDFRQAMADANGVDLSLLQRWYEQSGTPELSVTDSWDREARVYTLTFAQSCPVSKGQPESKPFLIPVKMGLLSKKGEALPLQLEGEEEAQGVERVINLTKAEETFRFTGLNEKPIPSLLRGFSAPVQLQYPWRDEQLAFLMANDPDEFNRWEAGQTLATNVLLGMAKSFQSGEGMDLSPHLLEAFRGLLEDKTADPALLAEALTLPDAAYLAEHMEVIDVDGIHAARLFMRRALGRELRPLWQSAYDDNQPPGEYVVDAQSMGKRRLKMCCLSYLLESGDATAGGLAFEQFNQASNMTDSMGALRSLVHSGAAQAEEALQLFHDRWKDDTLVMDKWFSVQVTIAKEGVLTDVRRLQEHPLFSMANPNKVRAVIGAFANANPVGFHAKDGSGYAFVADAILELDSMNPQVASRMSKVFTHWKRYDEQRQGLMKAQLERIRGKDRLSRDVFEIVDRSLS